jgi:hypothetical protein
MVWPRRSLYRRDCPADTWGDAFQERLEEPLKREGGGIREERRRDFTKKDLPLPL